MQRYAQVRMLGHLQSEFRDIVHNDLIVYRGRYHSVLPHVPNRIFAGLDIFFLAGLDFAEADIFNVAPAPLPVRAVGEFPADLLVFLGPFFDQLEFGLPVVVGNRNCLLGHHLGLAFRKAKILDAAVQVVPPGIFPSIADFLELGLRLFELRIVIRDALLVMLYAELAASLEGLPHLRDLGRGEEALARQLKQFEIAFLQVGLKLTRRRWRRRWPLISLAPAHGSQIQSYAEQAGH